ncbi:MAG: type II CAAX endopeptidase family protein [Candidatus Zixiibacteriota bacterium]
MNDQPTYNEHRDETAAVTVEPKQYPFRVSAGTYIVLVFLVLLFPAFNLFVAIISGNEMDFSNLDPVLFLFLPTVVMLWSLVLVVLLALWRERSSLSSIGLGLPTLTHVGTGILFFIFSSAFLMILQLILMALGFSFNENTDAILAIAGEHMGWWLVVSITAAICEEIIYRGYLMSRIKGVYRTRWILPVIASMFAFSSGHLYQGFGGAVLIGIYGLMFCLLYIYTGSIWPGVVAHFIQDYSAVFLYHLQKNMGF